MKYILLSVLAVAMVYALGAFITWEINPGKWEEGERLFAAFITMMSIIVAIKTSVELGKPETPPPPTTTTTLS